MGYTYIKVFTHFARVKSWYYLVPKHQLNNILVYEKEGKLKLGLEAYYTSQQALSNGTIGRAFWTAGLMGEKSGIHISVFINLENLTDTRQSKFGPIHTGSITSPIFQDIYAPVEGFVANGGIKLKW